MYSINTLEELDSWAQRHGLTLENDTELNLRRIDLISQNILLTCNRCEAKFNQKSNLLRHLRTQHSQTEALSCPHCFKVFKRQDNLRRHVQVHKGNKAPSEIPTSAQSYQRSSKRRPLEEPEEGPEKKKQHCVQARCNWCTQIKELMLGKPFCKQCAENGRECRWCHRPLPERFYSNRTDICDTCVSRRERNLNNQRGGGLTSALGGAVETETIEPNVSNIWDILQFFNDNQQIINNIITDRLQASKGLKWFLTLFIRFVKYNERNEAVYAEPTFRSINMTCTNNAQIEDQLSEAFQNLHNSFQNFERDGSGWSIDKILKLEISTAQYKPIEGSSYIPLPPKILKKKAVLNIQNEDQKCFMWSVLAALHPVSRSDNPHRVKSYSVHSKELNFSGLQFPLPLSQIETFEKQNGISINVFGLEGEEIYPLQITNLRNMAHHVNLLLFSKGETRHYCLIKNLSRLLGDRTSHNGQTYYCNYCLHGFTSQLLLDDHITYCFPHGPQKLSFPKSEEKQWVHFNSIQKQLKVPFVIYADFESFVQPIDSCQPKPDQSYTTKYQKHEACGFSYVVKCTHDELSKPARVYRGPAVVETFFERLILEENAICDLLDQVKPIKMTSHEEQLFLKTQDCHICNQPLGMDRVRDHDHISGQYRGAAHSDCNLQYQFRQGKRSQFSKFYIPVIFHNLRGYDMHHLMSAAGKFKDKSISCIPNNMEKYISFSFGNLRFIDSFQFLNASLDTLVSNLAKEGIDKFHNITKQFPDPIHQQLLLRKGIFPYDYVTGPEKFDEGYLPSQAHFYNSLNEAEVSDNDYDHAQKIWETFKMQTFGEYHDLYLMTDVLLLADVFENFRSLCLSYYHLDAAHYFTSPGLAWDAMLKMTGAKLQLLDDIDMVLMIENGIRGGVSLISKKYAKANNPHVPDYDPSKPNTWITYLDMNNLYGTCMSDPLPEKDFEWLSEDRIQSLDILSIDDNAETGYIFEVDLEYPPHLHDQDSDFPVCPETLTITQDMLSPYSLNLRKKLNLKHKPSKKLVPNLGAKTKYVVHYRNLKYYIKHGLHIKKIHRAISFTQSAWLKPYIDFNTQKRKQAKNAFEKELFKLLNNAVFGKFMENMRRRLNVELVNTPKRLRKVCAKPNFQSFKIFNEDLVAVNLKKTNIVLNRPTYIGLCILDISKVYMYQFHYDVIRANYGNRASLLFSDTDSLAYEITTEDWYADMNEYHDLFDTSNFPKDHPLYNEKNCKVLGKMKDECGGVPIESFVGLRPKMYSLMYGREQKQTAKGVKKCVIEKHLKHEAYTRCLFENTSMHHTMNMIRSYDHQLFSISVSKTSLCPYDDKKFVLDSGIDTLAHFHYKTIDQ